ncbi:MAG TPA: spermidine/putrescine ABC transporter substrate-binding protein [Candidatus Babeliales bacterium]|nr:spermidine/putrescine ABC transporter substrate-binding protein [Candidatus Babeliales bacterium]
MSNTASFRLLVRGGMIIFWCALIIIFLYSPLMRLLQPKKIITVLTWTDMIDAELLTKFEKKTGVKVRLSYFENNEELFIKLLAGRAQGFDLIIPSDYIMEKLIDNQLIMPIDRAKLSFWDRLNPELLGVYFDPKNHYSIPYHWAVYGLGLRTDVLPHSGPVSWKLLFDQTLPGKIAMLNSGREAVAIAAYYLYGALEKLSMEQQKEVYNLLVAQRPHVQAYVDADMRADYLLRSEQCNVAVVASPFIMNTLKQNRAINFEIPKEGGFLVLDNLVISRTTQNSDAVYDFINFLFEPEILKHHFHKYPFIPATKELNQWLQDAGAPSSLIEAYRLPISSLHFFRLMTSDQQLNHLWMAIKV